MRQDNIRGEVIGNLPAAVVHELEISLDCDVAQFDNVFHPTAQLHGFTDDALVVWPTSAYREILATRISPMNSGAPREQEILLIDVVSNRQAMVKVRVRINQKVFVDHLGYLRTDDGWRITSKAFHLEGSAP